MKNMILNKNLEITLHAGKSCIHDIELFTETLCSHLLVNETYFGNILITLSELYNIWIADNPKAPIEMSYSTDFMTLNIIITGLQGTIIDQLSILENLENPEPSTIADQLYLIQHLSDEISVNEEGDLQIAFDISAIHNRIYLERARLLHAFFNKVNSTKVASKNDHV